MDSSRTGWFTYPKEHLLYSEAAMQQPAQREKVQFVSGGIDCVGWHYQGTNGGCVVMAAGGAVTKEPGTDPFARRFNEAGFSVLAFDYRRLGESGGQPRQVVRIPDQLDDWRAAIALAGTLPEVDPARIAIWGFSLSGGHVFPVAARNQGLAAAIAQTPLVNGPAATRTAIRYTTASAMLRLTGRGLLDTIGGALGRKPLLVPLAGARGTVAMLSTPDGLDGDRALNPGNAYPEWQQEIAARSALRITGYRPGRYATRVRCPLLVVVCDDDQSAVPAPAVRAAEQLPGAELVRLPGGHYAPFMDAYQQTVDAELAFLRRRLLNDPVAEHPAIAAAESSPH